MKKMLKKMHKKVANGCLESTNEICSSVQQRARHNMLEKARLGHWFSGFYYIIDFSIFFILGQLVLYFLNSMLLTYF